MSKAKEAKMGFVLKVLEDGKNIPLYFKTKEDAQRFKDFAKTYIVESGSGNGYGAYWVMLDEPITEVSDGIGFCTDLDEDLVLKMRDSIISARLAGEDSPDEGITFTAPDLPPRKRPICGDLARTLFTHEDVEVRMDGRVIKDNGDTLELVPVQDLDKNGDPKPKAKTYNVPAASTMKIKDWLRKS